MSDYIYNKVDRVHEKLSVLHRIYKKRNKRDARNLSCWKKRK